MASRHRLMDADGAGVPAASPQEDLALLNTRAPGRSASPPNNRNVDETTAASDLESALQTTGCFGWRPPCAGKRTASPRFYTSALTTFGFAQSMVSSGLFALSVTSIQRQFGYTSQSVGALAAVYDSVAGVAGILVAHYLARAHAPRILGLCMLLCALGCLVFALPAFIAPTYDPRGIRGTELCGTADPSPACAEDTSPFYYLVFVFAQILLGLASPPIYTLGLTFFDDNTRPEYTSTHMAAFFSGNALGPALGYVLGGIFLGIFVSPGVTPQIDEASNAWVGAWWIGYLLAGSVCLLGCWFFFFIPRELPGLEWVRRMRRMDPDALMAGTKDMAASTTSSGSLYSTRTAASDDKDDATPLTANAASPVRPGRRESLFQSIWSLLKNPAYMGILFGNYADTFLVTGIGNFLPAFVETQFHLTSSDASFLSGASLIVGVASGMVLGGMLPRWRRWTPRQTARAMVVTSALSIVFFACFFVQCSSIRLAGVTDPFPTGAPAPPSNATSWAGCSAACLCESRSYLPVCNKATQETFFSPCAAGCTSDLGGGQFSNCTCVGDAAAALDTVLSDGKCSEGCTTMPLFLVLLFFTMLLVFFNGVPTTALHLRCVDEQHRSLALAFAGFAARVLGATIAPVITGSILDQACTLWSTTCSGERGSCFEYNNEQMALQLFLSAIIVKLIGTLGYFVGWLRFPASRDLPFDISSRYDTNAPLKAYEVDVGNTDTDRSVSEL